MGKVLQVITGSTKRIVGIMAHDFQRVFTNPVAAIIAVGVMVLPSLYAWFNIQASWDPYGSTDNISVGNSMSVRASLKVWQKTNRLAGSLSIKRRH